MHLPESIIHSDWGTEPKKRWSVSARLDGGRYVLGIPEKFDASSFPSGLLQRNAATLLGVDFAIGVPIEYAKAGGITDFLRMVRDAPSDFFEAVKLLGDVSPRRPFLVSMNEPTLAEMAKGTKANAVLAKIGLDPKHQLRRCERAPLDRNRGEACNIFLPLPNRQVAGATRTGWRDLLQPALTSARAGGRFKVWPFDGDLAEAIQPGTITIAETYPAEFYAHLGLTGNSKKARPRMAPQVRGTAPRRRS